MQNKEPGLAELIKRGGGFRLVPGADPQELLTNLIEGLQLPPSVDKKVLLNAVLEREALMSTAIGSGIALPHPRNPLVTNPEEQFVTITFAEQEQDWKALDGKPVHTVILIVSASAKYHLHTLSRINFFCRQEFFRDLLRNRASSGEILKTVEDTEKTWNNA
jgi:PTS system nitrogen regulatory IIA component